MYRLMIVLDHWGRIVTTILLSVLAIMGILLIILASLIQDTTLFNAGIFLIVFGVGVMTYRDRRAGRKDRQVISEKLQKLYDKLRQDSQEQLLYSYNDIIGIDIVRIYVNVVVDNKTPLNTNRISIGYRLDEQRVYAQKFTREVMLRQWHVERALLHINLAMKELGI